MTDIASKCNATYEPHETTAKGATQVHRCDQPVGHDLGHTSVLALGYRGVVWRDGMVGAKAHQVVHVRDPHDPEYLQQLLDRAWGVIANAGIHQRGWAGLDPQWVEAAERWRDEWHDVLSADQHARKAS